jgi:hypothetical protein
VSTAVKVTAGVISVAVLAGLIAMAAPALGSIWVATERPGTDALTHEPSEVPDLIASEAAAPPTATESTDYSTWSDADLAAARAEDPHPILINHPSRFAGDCLQNSVMTGSGMLKGAQTLVDMGSTEFARGTVTRNAEGTIATYTVAAGDAGMAIGERFCVDYITVFQYNDIYPTPQAGDVVLLLPASRS